MFVLFLSKARHNSLASFRTAGTRAVLVRPGSNVWFRMKSHMHFHLLNASTFGIPVEIISLKGDKKSVQTELQFHKKSIQRNSLGSKLFIMGDLKDIKKKLLAKGKGFYHVLSWSHNIWVIDYDACINYCIQSSLLLKKQKWMKNQSRQSGIELNLFHQLKEWMMNNWDNLLANFMLLLIRYYATWQPNDQSTSQSLLRPKARSS